MEEAAKVIKREDAPDTRTLLGIKLQPPAQVYAEQARGPLPDGDVRLLYRLRVRGDRAERPIAGTTQSRPPARGGRSSTTASTAAASTP